jgi:hypothetical protein
MEHFMRQLMRQHRELFGGLHVGQQTNLATERNPLSWRDGLVVFERDALFGNESS